MASYVTPKKNAEFIFYVALTSQSSRPQFQSNPTIASGDFKVSTDGGAFGNLSTLPAVTPASGRAVKITLSASEMNGDNIFVQCVDASGAEWDDLTILIQTSARQVDDLAYPNTSGRGMDVDASGGVEVGSFQAGAITAAAIAANALDAVWSTGTRLLTAGTNIVLAKGVGVTGFNDLSEANVRTGIGLASANLDTQLEALPTAAETADQVWDEAIAGHASAGSTGATLSGVSVDGVLDAVVEGSITLKHALRLLLSILVGKASGGGSSTITFRDTSDSVNRVSMTVDSQGNRTSVTRDVS